MRQTGSAKINDVGTTRIPAFDGHRLQAAREARGWSRGRLAIAVGSSVVSVGGWERGLRTPEPETLVKLANAVGLEAADLLSRPPAEWGLAEHRVTKGWEQRKVAKDVGIFPARMSSIELAYTEPDDVLYAKLAAVYGTTAQEMKAAWDRSRERALAD